MLDAICFVLFKKPFRKISQAQLINAVNEKEMLVSSRKRRSYCLHLKKQHSLSPYLDAGAAVPLGKVVYLQ